MATDPRTIINTDEDPGLVNPTGYVPSQSATNGTTEVKSVTINYTDPPLYGVPELQIFNDPGGKSGAVQFNVGNRLGGDSNFVWNSKNRTLSILGNIRISDSIIGKYNTNTKNLKITGGEDGYVLSTDGTGNISWIVAPSTTYGNSNVANYLPTYTGNVSANYFIGNGSQLTGLPTQYANSNVANYLPTYTGNLNGNNIIITDTGYIYNISSTGLASLTTVNVSSNLTTNAIYTNNYFYANGNVVPIGGSDGNRLVNGNNSFALDVDGNVVFQGISSGDAVNRGLVWDYGADANGVNSQVRQDNAGLTVRAWTENAGNYAAPVNIVTNQDANTKAWIFDGDGNLTLPGNLRLQSGNILTDNIDLPFNSAITGITTGNLTVIVTIADGLFEGPFEGEVTISNVTGTTEANGTWGYEATDFDTFQLYTDTTFSTPVDGTTWTAYVSGGNAVGVGTYADLTIQGGNVSISSNDQTWVFGNNGSLTVPGTITSPTDETLILVTAGSNGNSSSISIDGEFGRTLLRTYDGTTLNTWEFDIDGNLTLPNNTSSINYANGSPYGGGASGAGGIVFEYDIGNFTANSLPLPGIMQFTNRVGDVVTPNQGTKLWVSAIDGTGIDTSSTWLAMSQNSERGTVTLQQSGNQLPYRVSNIGVYNTPEVYRGYRAGVNQIWGDDPSINQIIITNATNPVFYNENFDIEDDVFHATNLAEATAVYMVNVYGSDEFNPLSQAELWSFFVNFVNNVIYQNTDTETQDVTEIRTAFYTNFNNLYNSINISAYDRDFRFASSTTYYSSAPVTGGLGSSATLRVRLNADYTYTVVGISAAGADYQVGDSITIYGNQLGGLVDTNDLVLTVDSVNGSGGITAVTINSGVAKYPWRPNSISDGGDDQYDTGNRIRTNLSAGNNISYNGGNVQIESEYFGGIDSEYVVMYNNSIFCIAATGVNITDLYYSGNLGSDGNGFLRWSGLRNTSSATSVQYAYMDCELGTGNLTPAVGETYQVALDSTGINLDQFYSYLNDDNDNWYFGINRDWVLESRQQLNIQSYSSLNLRTLIPTEADGVNSPSIYITTDTGGDGNAEFNQQAGPGGEILIRAGSAGTNDNVPTLGGNGGSIEIIAGDATGNNQQGGGVLIEAGAGAGGQAGNLTLRTRSGTTANGSVRIETNNGVDTPIWVFGGNGSLTLPIGVSIDSSVSALYPKIIADSGKLFSVQGQGSTGSAALAWSLNPNTDTQYAAVGVNQGGGDNLAKVVLTAGNTTATLKVWKFDETGAFTLPEGSTLGETTEIVTVTLDQFIAGGYSNPVVFTKVNDTLYELSPTGPYMTLISGVWRLKVGPSTYYDSTDLITWSTVAGGLPIPVGTLGTSATTNLTVNNNTWAFDSDGNLTLPGDTFAVNYSNGTQVSLGGSYSNSDVANYLPTYTGNVSANYFIGDGSLLTGLPTATVTQDITSNGAMSIMTYDGNLKYVSYATVEPSSGNIAGGNISTTGNVSANYFIGNGATLTYITGSNVNGNVTSAVQSHYANIANSVAGSNVSGQVGNSLISGTVYTNAQPNITSVGTLTSLTISGNVTANNLGNISIINLDGNSSNVLYGNGVFVAAPSGGSSSYGNSNVATFLSSFGSNTISTTGNANIGNINAVKTVLTGTSVTGVNSILAGPTFTPLANTTAGFVSNVNSYTQLTIQNKSTGADATTDFVATADNGSDTVNYLDLGIINSGYDNGTPTNSLGNIVFAADSYIYAQGNTSATGQSGGNLAIGTTVATKTVKIFAGGVTSNSIVASFANTGANITGSLNVSGNITGANISGNISITGNIQGTSSNVSLVAGSYTMTFDNTGILTLPRMGGDEGGEINLGIPASNTTLSTRVVLDVYQDRLRFFDGSTKGAYIDLSQASSGVGTLLNNRVSAFVNAGTFVTMDNIKATVTTTGNRGLSLATVSGSFAYSIGGTYGMATPASGGSAGTGTLTTTATASIFNWGFTSTGDTATYIVTNTSSLLAYRITLQIGASFNNNMISIERLI
jgi:hypothetical protein